MEREDHDCERMIDIVERLTAEDNLTSVISTCTCKPGRHPADLSDLMKEAANEIERLRAENEKFYKQAEMNARLLTENASLRAEIEKLHREAAIRIDQIEREQEAHLKTMADLAAAIRESGE